MKVRVKFFTVLRELTGKKEEEIDLPNTITVEELLSLLSERHGRGFTDYVYDEEGRLRDHLQFLVNGRSITNLQGFETSLEEGNTFAIIPPVGGG